MKRKRKNDIKQVEKVEEEEEEEEEDQVIKVEGKRDEEGELNGFCKVEYSNGQRFEGNFEKGKKSGFGTIWFPDGATLRGNFHNNLLQGLSTLEFPEEDSEEESEEEEEKEKKDEERKEGGKEKKRGKMEAEYKNGQVKGQCKEWDSLGRIVFSGTQEGDNRKGRGVEYWEGGGRMEGQVNASGQLMDASLVWYYPDETGYVGKWKQLEMVEGYFSKNPKEEKKRTRRAEEKFAFDPPTDKRISKQPLLKDPYETKHVYVAPSRIKGAKEGLFAKVQMKKGTVAAFYSGIHTTHQIVDERDWELNNNTISMTNFVIDVPSPFDSTDHYCASLGHKANHSFTPNCIYGWFQHPRFGFIRTVEVSKEGGVESDEELVIDYDYHEVLSDGSLQAPLWYKNLDPKTK